MRWAPKGTIRDVAKALSSTVEGGRTSWHTLNVGWRQRSWRWGILGLRSRNERLTSLATAIYWSRRLWYVPVWLHCCHLPIGRGRLLLLARWGRAGWWKRSSSMTLKRRYVVSATHRMRGWMLVWVLIGWDECRRLFFRINRRGLLGHLRGSEWSSHMPMNLERIRIRGSGSWSAHAGRQVGCSLLECDRVH